MLFPNPQERRAYFRLPIPTHLPGESIGYTYDSYGNVASMSKLDETGSVSDQQIAVKKSFVLTNDPALSGGYFFAKEVAYLTKKGISYVLLK